jgi:uncharacterized protein
MNDRLTIQKTKFIQIIVANDTPRLLVLSIGKPNFFYNPVFKLKFTASTIAVELAVVPSSA